MRDFSRPAPLMTPIKAGLCAGSLHAIAFLMSGHGLIGPVAVPPAHLTLLEEEVIPAIQQCLQRVDAIDAGLQEEQEERIAIELLRQQLAADAEGIDALEALVPL